MNPDQNFSENFGNSVRKTGEFDRSLHGLSVRALAKKARAMPGDRPSGVMVMPGGDREDGAPNVLPRDFTCISENFDTKEKCST